MDSDVDIQVFRRDLFSILDTIASGGSTFQFGFEELCCMWFDDHWYGHESHEGNGILSESEYQILSRFNEIFEKQRRLIGNIDLRDLQNDQGWQLVVKAAQDAKIKLDVLRTTKGH